MLRTALLVLLLTGSAHAEIDWAKGLVTAPGIGLADRQAPNPAVARGPARRRAEDAARVALAKLVPTVPLAGGGTVADRLGDAAVKARVEAAVAAAIGVTAELATDGSWKVTMAVPIEAIRQALVGPRALGPAGDAGPSVVIVEGVPGEPALGATVGGLAAATIWTKDLPAWTKGAPRIKARAVTGAAIDADIGKATAATLFVIAR